MKRTISVAGMATITTNKPLTFGHRGFDIGYSDFDIGCADTKNVPCIYVVTEEGIDVEIINPVNVVVRYSND